MIRTAPVLLLLAASHLTHGAAARAQEAGCTLANAAYVQADTGWVLRFSPVPRDASSNQHNAFRLPVPGTDVAIDGGVWSPNGYGGRWGVMDIGCPDGGDAPGCNLWEGTVYQAGPDGVAELADEDAPPPAQILFPDLGRTLWYTVHPDVAFRAALAGDIFTLQGCAG